MPHPESTKDAGENCYLRFLDGDEEGLRELITLYRESLTRFINVVVRNRAEAEDLMIDAFAQLVVSRSFAGRSSLKTYLFQIGRNLALKHVKKQTKKDTVPFDDCKQFSADDQSVESDLLHKETKRALYAGIVSLKPEYRDVLYMQYFEEMDTEEIARILNKTKKQVGNLAFRAKAALKKKLESEGITDAHG